MLSRIRMDYHCLFHGGNFSLLIKKEKGISTKIKYRRKRNQYIRQERPDFDGPFVQAEQRQYV